MELIVQITAYQCYEKDKHITRHWPHEKREEAGLTFELIFAKTFGAVTGDWGKMTNRWPPHLHLTIPEVFGKLTKAFSL